MFKVLITTSLSTMQGNSVHTTVAEFAKVEDARLAIRAVAKSSQNSRHRLYSQTALALNFDESGHTQD